MEKTYSCTVCKEEFRTKAERHNHFRNQCKQSHSLADGEGKILQVERVEGKFQCPSCQTEFTHSTNLTRHWKQCIKSNGTESNTTIYLKSNYLVAVDRENELVENLRYDGIHHLAVCVKCEFALPIEWVQKHFKDHHKIVVIHHRTMHLT